MLDQLPDRYRRVLIDAGITEPQDALAAGEDGLVALDGIGAKSARLILEVAGRLAPEPESAGITPEPEPARQMELAPSREPESERITPDSDAPPIEVAEEAPAAEAALAETPASVVVRLIGRSAAVLGTRVIYRNEAREVSYHQFAQAQRQYPAGTFQIRFPGDSAFRGV